MKRKKKRMSALTRVLLCSWCVLMLVLTFFVIKWTVGLSELRNYADAGSVDNVTEGMGGTVMTPPVSPGGEKRPDGEKIPGGTPEAVPQAQFSTEHTHLGEMTEVFAYTEGVATGLRYPVYEDESAAESVGREAGALLSEAVEELTQEDGTERTLLIDYEDGETAGLYSVLFFIEKEIDGEKRLETRQWIFNKKKGETVDAGMLFAERAYQYIAEQVNAGLAESEEAAVFSGTRGEFAEYLLTADGARFYYELDGIRQSVVIPYIALHTYMAVTVNGTVVADGIRKLDPEKPMIALTFDDGPHYQQTPRLLQILEENGARATFFILGDRSYFTESNKETVKLVADSGNEIASHTYAHKDLSTLSAEELKNEITMARDNLFALTGEYPTFIRPPYGSYNDLVKEYSYAPLITWNLDSQDWESRNTEKIVEHVLEEAGNGKIVLMHDIHWFTVDAAELLIPELIAQGYQIVTVRELLYYRNIELENGTVYHSGYN